MKFYIDTALIEEIREANKRGLVDGVTTNPSLVAKTGKPHNEVIKEICQEVNGLVSAEVTVASEIDAAAQAKIKELVHALTQKSPELDIKTDPDIIGGLKIKVGNTILDASLKSKLERMHQALLEPEQASS